MGVSQKIAVLLEKRRKVEKEIAKLQKSCKHSGKSVKQIWEYVDSSTPIIRYICDECLMVLGYPNQQEKDNYFKE
tara:strand:+ start:343 stop:567 length:225 start_codon:yes stop_codon:yes gene_type:complete